MPTVAGSPNASPAFNSRVGVVEPRLSGLGGRNALSCKGNARRAKRCQRQTVARRTPSGLCSMAALCLYAAAAREGAPVIGRTTVARGSLAATPLRTFHNNGDRQADLGAGVSRS